MPDSVPNDATGYVFVAYTFFLVVMVVYIGILAGKFQRLNKEIDQLSATEDPVPLKPGAGKPDA